MFHTPSKFKRLPENTDILIPALQPKAWPYNNFILCETEFSFSKLPCLVKLDNSSHNGLQQI